MKSRSIRYFYQKKNGRPVFLKTVQQVKPKYGKSSKSLFAKLLEEGIKNVRYFPAYRVYADLLKAGPGDPGESITITLTKENFCNP